MTSRYHTAVRALVEEIYPDKEIRDEQNLWELVKAALPARHKKSYNRLFVDIYVPEENLCIEVHGEQHEKPVQFAKELDAEEALLRRKHLDHLKSDALAEAGFSVLVLWYGDIDGLTAKELKRRIFIAKRETSLRPAQRTDKARPATHRTASEAYTTRDRARRRRRPPKKRTESPEQRQARLDKARELRQAAYRRAKERKNDRQDDRG